jgi:divalent metal cation (Fe/Co/Zn/Cd) transporter
MLDGLFKILLLIMMLGLSVIYLGLNSWALKEPDQHPVCVAVVLFVTFVLPLFVWMYMIGAFPK